MTKRNPDNERIKHRYFDFLRHADGKSDQTIRQVEKALLRYEEVTGFAKFKTFDQRRATDFKDHLAESGLSLPTVHSTLKALQRFLGWLAMQDGFKRCIRKADIAYLNLSDKDTRAAQAPADKSYPSLRMIERVVEVMPDETPIQKRDRALIMLTALTAIRDGAMITLKLKHFDTERRLVMQDPREVSTKFSKRIDTFLFPLNDTFEPLVLDYVRFLREDLLFGDHDPLFPKTAMGHDENNCFMPVGLSREHWATATPMRGIFKRAFVPADLDPYTPHRFRDMILSEMYARKLSIPEFKAWSQNLGHEGAMTSLTSYGTLSLEEQRELVRKPAAPDEQLMESAIEIARILKRRSGE
jgi:integrase